MTIAYIGLGSNLGDRNAHINSALKLLSDNENIELVRTSDIIETAPLVGLDQPKYLNAVAEVKTSLSPQGLLEELVEIETSLGRVRKEKWSSRIIDLDILLFGSQVINEPALTIPHRQMHLRSFVLKGLCRLNNNLVHPVLKETVSVLAERLNGRDFFLNPDVPQLVSVAGVIGVGKTTLAENLSGLFGCKSIREAYDKNPYLPKVYAGEKELALDSQVFFLSSRVAQLNPKNLPPGRITISDYIFEKELIYARCLLSAEQMSLYEKTYRSVRSEVAQPVLAICLIDSAENCLKRIHKRNRPYEQKIELGFLQDLGGDYDELFAHWKTCPVIRLLMSDFDCENAEDLQYLAKQITSYIVDAAVIASPP